MDHTDEEHSESTFWPTVGRAFASAGRAVGASASVVGRSVADVYLSVDRDLRRQLFQAPLIGLMALAPRRAEAEVVDKPPSRPVIFVHGLGGHPNHFFAAQKYFDYRGRSATHAIDVREGESLEEMAARLRDLIERVSAGQDGAAGDDSASQQVDIIGHSMGGIVARLALEERRTRTRVANLVTMATPHSGTHLARLADTPRTLDLRPDSKIIERLARQDFWSGPDGPRLLALWSRADTTILPASSAAWPAAETMEMPDFTHLSYLISPTCWRELVEALDA